MRELRVFDTVGEAYRGAWNHGPEMVRIVWLPALVYAFVAALNVMMAPAPPPPGEEIQPGDVSLLGPLLFGLVTMFISAILAVAWHRFILLGQAPSGAYYFSFGRRELLYVIVSIGLILLIVPGLVAAGVFSTLLAGSAGLLATIIVVGITLYFFVRASLLLPAVAVDHPVDVRRILSLTQSHFWPLLGVLVISSLLFAVIALVIMMPVGLLTAGLGALGGAVNGLVGALLNLAYLVVSVAVLSIAYRELGGLDAMPQAPPPAPTGLQ